MGTMNPLDRAFTDHQFAWTQPLHIQSNTRDVAVRWGELCQSMYMIQLDIRNIANRHIGLFERLS